MARRQCLARTTPGPTGRHIFRLVRLLSCRKLELRWNEWGSLTIGLFDAADPSPGHQSVLDIVELGEQLGFDCAWVRHRHLQHGISSPVAVLAAATQRTSRIALGTGVIPLGSIFMTGL
jgi:Luciferase-like monooxygenase